MTTATETRLMACADCGRTGPIREVHTYLFCELHKMGWSREKIIANVLFTADALRGVTEETPK